MSKIIAVSEGLLFILLLIVAASVLPGTALAMPVPESAYYYEKTPADSPVKSAIAAEANPIGIGTVAEGGDTLSIRVGLEQFSGPVDIYFAIFAPALDPNNIYLLRSDNGIQTISQGLAPWRAGITGPVEESIFGDIPVSGLPPGTYQIYLAVTPAGSLDRYYIWATSFIVSGATVSLPPTTKIMDAQSVQQLVNVSSDISTFTFSGSTPQIMALKTGDIINIGVTSLTPNGALRKVTATASQGDQVMVQTIQATIEEAIENGKILLSRTLSPNDVASSQAHREGVAVRRSAAGLEGDLFTIDFNDTVVYDRDGDPYSLYDQVIINGSLSFSLNILFEADIEWFKLKKLQFKNIVTEDLNIEVSSKVEVPVLEKKLQLAKYRFAPIQVGPVTLVPELSLVAGLEGNVTIGVTSGVTQTATLTTGVMYSNGDWSPIADFSNEFDFIPPTLEDSLQVKAYAGGELALLLYGLAGPYGNINGSLRLDVDVFDQPWWKLYGGLFSDVGIKVDVLGREIADFSATVINYEKLLAQAAATPACTYTYGDWGACQPDGTQTRTMLSSSPAGCTGTPALSQACTYEPPPCTAYDLQGTWVATWDHNYEITLTATSNTTFTGKYTNISNSNSFQGTISSSGITVNQYYANGSLVGSYNFKLVSPTELQGPVTDYTGATYTATWQKKNSSAPPICTSYTYSDWGACQSDNTQTRTMLSSSPAGCTGTPVLSQACTYVPPVIAGRGELSFVLTWDFGGSGEGPDVDLHVISPTAEHIYFNNMAGHMDYDDKGACGTDSWDDGRGPERIWWGPASNGTYEYWVHWYESCGYSSATYTIKVYVKPAGGSEQLVATKTGTISSGESAHYTYNMTQGSGGGTPPPPSPGMVSVPAGCFQMGDTFGVGGSFELPVHQVCLSSFSIDRYEVTQTEYLAVTGTNPSYFTSCGGNCPVEQVTWSQADAYCKAVDKRLPTEAEWEYAARSGGQSQKWAGTSAEAEVGNYAWYSANSGDTRHPVGQKLPNGLGLYDMSGNVWEWVADWFGPYSATSQNNPQGPSYNTVRVFRGGSWNYNPGELRTSRRRYGEPGIEYVIVGFRCARTP
ncbi:MAG: SUMF1/EgtB/PvdO family nonheme iron enzyme [Nitrospirae bacterium]|nr:SUMF1/EgtB/PvdO family nonheme iron enzyme [Nitrospirota bacterium]